MLYTIFLILFFLVFSVLAFKRLDWAVMLIIAGLPLYTVRFKAGIPMTLLEAMILIAFFCWLIFQTRLKDFLRGRYGVKEFLQNSPFHKVGSIEGRRFYPFGIEAVLLLVISFIAVGIAGFSDNSLGIWKAYFFEPLLLYILILNVIPLSRGVADRPGCVKGDLFGVAKIGLALAFGALVVSVYAVFQKITGLGIDNPLWAAAETRRVVSFFGYPNAVGLYLAPIIPVLAAFLFLPTQKENKKIYFPLKKENITAIGLSRGFLGLIILLSLLSIYFAKSEGAIVGLVAGAIIFGLLAGRRAMLATLAILIIATAGIYFYQPARHYAIEKLTLKDFSGQLRRYQWKETLVMLNDGHFYQGAGLNNYQKVIAPYHQEGFFYDDGTDPLFHQHTVESAEYRVKTWRPAEIYLYPHNIILNFWTELGLAGLLLFVWIFGKILFIATSNFKFQVSNFSNSKEKFLIIGVICSMVVILVHGLVDVPCFKNDLSALFWILIALTVLSGLNLTNEKKTIK